MAPSGAVRLSPDAAPLGLTENCELCIEELADGDGSNRLVWSTCSPFICMISIVLVCFLRIQCCATAVCSASRHAGDSDRGLGLAARFARRAGTAAQSRRAQGSHVCATQSQGLIFACESLSFSSTLLNLFQLLSLALQLHERLSADVQQAAAACGGGRLRSTAGRLYSDDKQSVSSLFSGQTLAFEAKPLPGAQQLFLRFALVDARKVRSDSFRVETHVECLLDFSHWFEILRLTSR